MRAPRFTPVPRGLVDWLQAYPLTLALGAGAALLAMASVSVVGDSQQAVLVRLGAPLRVINPAQGPGAPAGLVWHLPLADRLVRVERREMAVAVDHVALVSADGAALEADALVRLRIVDPVRLVRAAGTGAKAAAQWQPAFAGLLQQGLAGRSQAQLLGAEGSGGLEPLRAALAARAALWGATVGGLELTRVALRAGAPVDQALARMQLRLKGRADDVRLRGLEAARSIQNDADTRAAQIASRALAQDPAFYDYWRALQSYNAVLGGPADKGGTTIVLGPDSAYLRAFREPPGGPK